MKPAVVQCRRASARAQRRGSAGLPSPAARRKAGRSSPHSHLVRRRVQSGSNPDVWADDRPAPWFVPRRLRKPSRPIRPRPVAPQSCPGRREYPRGESAATTYLLYDGRRARVDLRNHAAVRALKLDGVAPRPVSRALLDAVPEAPGITTPVHPCSRHLVCAARLPGGYGGATDSRRLRGVLRRARRRRPACRRGRGRPHQVQHSTRHDIVTVAPDLIGNAPDCRRTSRCHIPRSRTRLLCTRSGAVLVGDSLRSEDDQAIAFRGRTTRAKVSTASPCSPAAVRPSAPRVCRVGRCDRHALLRRRAPVWCSGYATRIQRVKTVCRTRCLRRGR